MQPGGPPILVGGGGEQRTLRLAARFADLTHWFIGSLDEFKHKLDVLERHCETEGRDLSTITKTIGSPVEIARDESEARAMAERRGDRRAAPAVVPGQAAEILSEYVRAGVQGFVFRNPNLTNPELLQAAGRLKQLLS